MPKRPHKPSADPVVAAFQVVQRLTQDKPAISQKKAADRPKPSKRPAASKKGVS